MQRAMLNYVLGAVVAGLGAAVYLSREKEEKGPPLTPLAADAVTTVAIEHPGAPAIRMEKAGGQWQLVEPVKSPVDPLEANGVISLATAEVKLTLEDKDLPLKELGLDPPSYVVTLNDQKIEFGGVEPINYRRYLRAGGKVVLVDDPPGTVLDQDYSDLVSKAPLPQDKEIVKVVLPKLAVARSEDGKSWTVTPDQPDASSDARQKFIDGWKNARAMWMASEPDGSKGEPVTITFKDGTEVNLLIAERDPQLVLVRPDLKVRYTLSKALEKEILELPVEPKEAIGEVPNP